MTSATARQDVRNWNQLPEPELHATSANVKWLCVDQPETEVDFHAVARAIDQANGDHLIVLAGPDGISSATGRLRWVTVSDSPCSTRRR